MSRSISSIVRKKLFERAMNEDQDRKYEYGGVLAHLDIPFWDDIMGQINDDEVYMPEECGKEWETHTTVLYGIDDSQVSVDDVRELVEDVGPFPIYLTSISIFDNEEFDVLKFDVESEDIHKLHEKVADTFPHEQMYPTYKPHVTIAYLKKGHGEKYTKDLDEPVKLSVETLYYTDTDRNKTYFDLRS